MLLEVQLENFYYQSQFINQKMCTEIVLKTVQLDQFMMQLKTDGAWHEDILFVVFQTILTVAAQIPVRKVLMGHNLESHFSAKLTEACKTSNILFICLPPYSTHLFQPLDVAIFRALEVEWKDILDT